MRWLKSSLRKSSGTPRMAKASPSTTRRGRASGWPLIRTTSGSGVEAMIRMPSRSSCSSVGCFVRSAVTVKVPSAVDETKSDWSWPLLATRWR